MILKYKFAILYTLEALLSLIGCIINLILCPIMLNKHGQFSHSKNIFYKLSLKINLYILKSLLKENNE